jgi:hypothetical protein
MTREEIQAMSDAELDLTIFKKVPRAGCGECSTNLNHCQSVESTLTPEQWIAYINTLCGEISTDMSKVNEPETYIHRIVFIALNATARQRAEALLMVLTEVNP